MWHLTLTDNEDVYKSTHEKLVDALNEIEEWQLTNKEFVEANIIFKAKE